MGSLAPANLPPEQTMPERINLRQQEQRQPQSARSDRSRKTLQAVGDIADDAPSAR